ncbi:primosomal protein N' [bacterium]|nr:primosomal protein N' [bacterium]
MQLQLVSQHSEPEDNGLFAEVILPLAVDGTFTYRVPHSMHNLAVAGKRVTVQFGRRHIYTGVIDHLHHQAPKGYKTKALLEILDENPIIQAYQLNFWKWISAYYLCTIGEVLEAALPNYMKLKSETKVVLHPEYKKIVPTTQLTANEKLAIEALEHEHELSLSDLQELLKLVNAMPLVRDLHFKGLIMAIEDLKSQYKAKTVKYLKLNPEYRDETTLAAVFEVLEGSKTTQKQSEALTRFIMLSKNNEALKKLDLLQQKEVSKSSVQSLIKKDILVEEDIAIDRWQLAENETVDFDLNEYQEKALDEIKAGIHLQKPVLFHGITGSGKTLVYLRLLEDYIADHDKQALYLVPEIALTTQLLSRLSSFFNGSIAVYHSRLSNNERYELWMGIKSGQYKLVVGARSALFLPFANLRMIIVDEEHEASFKQQNPAPRYNGRDAAIFLAKSLQIPIVLGSATPSLESFQNAQSDKYHYVYLGRRFGNVQIPQIKLIDLREEQKTKSIVGNISRQLKIEIEKHLNHKHQVILFQNRRGYAPVIECSTCGWVPFCKNCDIILTYHKYNQTISCHYCGFSNKMPTKCENCGDNNLSMKGTGTERLEDELTIMFPNRILQRMDLDTTRRKNSLEEIINAVENGTVDILVGTQMVTKGLDFERVKLVGVISGDGGLHYPDFRASERTFQMLVQVAGRSGRKGERGEVCIQTYQPDHYMYQMLLTHNQKEFYQTELQQRQTFKYPPYYRIIKVTVRHSKVEKVNLVSDLLRHELLQLLRPDQIFGPEFGSSPRLKNRYHKVLMLKCDNNPKSISQAKKALLTTIDKLKSNPKAKSVDYIIDVDPY